MVSRWLFLFAVILYMASAAGHFIYFYLRQGERAARWLARAAWLLHTGALIAVVMESGHPPLYTTWESILFMTWAIFLNYLILEYLFNLRMVGVFLVPVIFVFLIYAASLPKGADVSRFPVDNQWVIFHALIALGGYGTFALAFVAAIMYLMLEKQLRSKAFRKAGFHRLPSLETLDNLSYRLIVAGFPLLTLAIVTGTVWARSTWGATWFWEPKGIWSGLTWGIYAIYLYVRARGVWGRRRLAYLVVAGFVAVLFNLFVVNLVLSQKHVF